LPRPNCQDQVAERREACDGENQGERSRHHRFEQEGGFLKQLYVVFTTPTNGIEPVMRNVKEHLEFQVTLEKQGIMFAAGPNWTDNGKSWEGDGMVVIRAKSLAEATEIIKRDPMHKSGARKFKIRPGSSMKVQYP
jgi:uncharacterized protein YciI